MAAPNDEHHKAKAAQVAGGVVPPPIYWRTIQQQVAQGLHLTVAQAKAQLQCNAPVCPGIAEIAAANDFYQARLHNIEIGAIRVAANRLVRLGTLTPRQADQVVQQWQRLDNSELNRHITNWLREDW